MIGSLIGWGMTIGMVGLGVAATAAPGPISTFYGVPQGSADGHAWVRAAGLRDLGLAAILGAALVRRDDSAVAIAMIATGAVAVTDFANVVSRRGLAPKLPLAVHTSGILGGLVGGALVATRAG